MAVSESSWPWQITRACAGYRQTGPMERQSAPAALLRRKTALMRANNSQRRKGFVI
ncbi:MAG: hypothetical protein ACLT0Y_01315 [Christensenellales bacterium]